MGYVVKGMGVAPITWQYTHEYNKELETIVEQLEQSNASTRKKRKIAKKNHLLFSSLKALSKYLNKTPKQVENLHSIGWFERHLYQFDKNTYAYETTRGVVLGVPSEEDRNINTNFFVCRITGGKIGIRDLYTPTPGITYLGPSRELEELLDGTPK